jgi:hypothetical protein
MAARILRRRALRELHEQAEKVGQSTAAASEALPPKTKVKKTRIRKTAAKMPGAPKASPKPRARKKTVKALPRMFARWAVCDGGFKRVAVFEFNQRADADAKLIQLQEAKKGPFFLQLVKDPFDPPVVDSALTA